MPIVYAIVFVMSLFTHSLSLANPALVRDYHIEHIDRTFDGKHYRLFIATPKVRFNQTALYLLDANVHLPKALNEIDYSKPLPMLVGIGYVGEARYFVPERTRDYTPPAQGEAFRDGGGSAQFLAFIETDVKPYIQRHYDVQKSLFFGHSFGGLFGLYAMTQHSHLFEGYILASPSLWWGESQWLMPYWHDLPKPHFVVFTLGEFEAHPMRDPTIDKARLARIEARRAGLKVEQVAKEFQRQGVKSEFVLLPKVNHGAAISPALHIALQYAQ
ncbi:alpha/beta hydrolase [Spirabiliibacterium falconis]|uniref:alpha/beta hydrolase n=1 Tax=Spirabiliibacterium falconis TaxID=572023 RepID=UPI001AAD80B3|nr:alpha/beta fold hydrolase [Spirabiliibacterium falconis]MBE2893579.1 alpha/beta hydrolase [Spirabiliibacterium falconis]